MMLGSSYSTPVALDMFVIAKDKPIDAEWTRINSIVKSWVYATLSKPLHQMIFKRNKTKSNIWKTLKDIFLGQERR